MQPMINVADLVDQTDPQKRTFRQINAEKVHSIPVGALVEVAAEEGFYKNGIRLFVVYHGRDCDMTPLYYLCDDPTDTVKEIPGFINRRWCGGYSEGGLRVIELPAQPQAAEGGE